MRDRSIRTSEASSFRDPSGYIFREGDQLYRQINPVYLPIYDRLQESGFLKKLQDAKLLVSHREVSRSAEGVIIEPELIPFISYPYEWCFSELQDAALLTLKVQKLALENGFSLKDASAYNIQFLRGKPILIDTLSFEPYQDGQPWVAYRQFCQHFLAPLALMATTDIRLNRLLELYIDGIPLDLASRLLPRSTRFNFGLLPHLHMHAKSQQRHGSQRRSFKETSMAKVALLGLIDSLESTTRKLKLRGQQTEWEHYYHFTNYSDTAEISKSEHVRNSLRSIKPQLLWDLGANTGHYSRLASAEGIYTVASDIDPLAVERSYKEVQSKQEKLLLPLVIDFTNPSPAIGWENRERSAFLERRQPDAIMALALIHHLAISNNLPLPHIAQSFANLTPYLIIEFIPKEDSQVQKLLATREDIFPQYSIAGFEDAFNRHFRTIRRMAIKDSQRTLYLMKRIHQA